MDLITTIPPLISSTLVILQFILGLICIISPKVAIHFLLQATSPTATTVTTTITGGENNNNANELERILIRLLGSLLMAYTLNSLTQYYFFSTSNVTKHQEDTNTNMNTNNNDNAINANNGRTTTSVDRITIESNTSISNSNRSSSSGSKKNRMIVLLVSFIYLGMSTLLITLFEIYYSISSTDENDNDDERFVSFMNLVILAASYVIFPLLGLIASFYPRYDSTTNNYNVNDDNDENGNQMRRRENRLVSLFQKVLCCCESRVAAATTTATAISEDAQYFDVEDTNGVDTTPLLQQQEEEVEDEFLINDNPNTNDNESDAQPQQQQQQQNSNNDHQPTSTKNRLSGTIRVIQAVGPHSLYLFIGCIVLLIRLPFSLSIPHFVSETLVSVAQSKWQNAQSNILFLFLFGTIDATLDFFCVFLFGLSTVKIARSIRIDLFHCILQQDIAFFDNVNENSSGELTSRINADCGAMATDLTWFFRFSIESIVRISGIVIYMLWRAPRLALCAVSVVPIVALVNKKYGDWLSTNARDVQTALASANSVAQEALISVRTVIAFASENDEERKYKSKIDEYYNLNVKQLYATGFYYMLVSTFLINTCIQALLLYVGMVFIQSDEMNADVLLAFMLYQSQLQNEVMNLFNSYTSLLKSSGSGDKVFQLLDRIIPPPGTGCSEQEECEQDEEEDFLILQGEGDDVNESSLSGDIIMKNVRFSYPARQNELVLDGLNLHIASGETVALVGKSGCGKTTIYNLLQRFYDPTCGEITISGMDLKKCNMKQYRQTIGIVTQDPVLFTGTIKSNITYSTNENITHEDVIEAAKLADAHSFIESFPLGYDTQVGERGVQLSGGQKQRIAIARALVRKPKILLLDEATSALDSESEKLVQKAIENLLKTKRKEMTTLIIAHRLSTVKNADKIFVLEAGKVVEEGSHEQLRQEKDGVYNKMLQQSLGTL